MTCNGKSTVVGCFGEGSFDREWRVRLSGEGTQQGLREGKLKTWWEQSNESCTLGGDRGEVRVCDCPP